ncbi:DUF2878 domain-containing protein [Alteromonas sp. CYL-A6]|uniref:DUF2878 domain-containing protein n=1 Tax=Alteromonas nitratireducens TaxID=3390813 RepID=UPI0034ACCF35
MSSNAVKNGVNFVWFQAIWFLAIFFQYEWFWLIIMLLFGFFIVVGQRLLELKVMVSVAVTGVIVDSALTGAGVFIFDDQVRAVWIPWWLVTLWLGFAGTLRHSLRYLGERPWLCVAAGGISGPLSYLAGERLGAVSFGYPLTVTLVILSAVWAALLPLSFYLMKRAEQAPLVTCSESASND